MSGEKRSFLRVVKMASVQRWQVPVDILRKSVPLEETVGSHEVVRLVVGGLVCL